MTTTLTSPVIERIQNYEGGFGYEDNAVDWFDLPAEAELVWFEGLGVPMCLFNLQTGKLYQGAAEMTALICADGYLSPERVMEVWLGRLPGYTGRRPLDLLQDKQLTRLERLIHNIITDPSF